MELCIGKLTDYSGVLKFEQCNESGALDEAEKEFAYPNSAQPGSRYLMSNKKFVKMVLGIVGGYGYTYLACIDRYIQLLHDEDPFTRDSINWLRWWSTKSIELYGQSACLRVAA